MIFIDPNPAICHGQQCAVVKGEMLTFSDGSHLSLNGAETIGMYILQQIFPDCPDLTADTK